METKKEGWIRVICLLAGGLILAGICQAYSGGSGTAADPYQIATKADLLLIMPPANQSYYILTADIDLEGETFSYAVIAPYESYSSSYFSGIFDGNGYKITNFHVVGQNNNNFGFFGVLGQGGQIKNLGVEDYSISGLTGSYYAGGLVGTNYGTISQCYTTGTISAEYSVGGLVGYNYGTISDCYAAGSVSAKYSAGGLVGYLNSGTISNCYATGPVSSTYYGAGGLIGIKSSGTVTNSYWDMQTSGQGISGLGTSGAGVGKTTAQMKTMATFAGIGPMPGRVGDALYFDGVGGYMKVAGFNGIGGANARTISMWVMPVSNGKVQTLIQWGDTGDTGHLWLVQLATDGTVLVSTYGGGVQSSHPLRYGQWHHVVVVLQAGQTDSRQIELYVDDQPQAVATTEYCTINTSQATPVYLGTRYMLSTTAAAFTNYFCGLMDEVCIYDRALDAEEIVSEIAMPAEGLAAHWPMDETQGDMAYDTAGDQDAVVHNVANSGWVSGRTDNALAFDGTNDYVEIPGYYGIGGTSARTVSLWLKTSTTGQTQTLVQWGSDSAGQLWLVHILNTNKIQVAAYGGGVSSTAAVTDGQWHYIAAVLGEGQADSSQIRLYIDGVLDAVAVGECTIATTQTVPLQLGAWYASNTGTRGNYFSGLLDDVCIYDRALPAEEIIPTDPIPTDGLVSHWAMDETLGTVVSDSAGNWDGVSHVDADYWVSGWTGNALRFDGINDYVNVPGYYGIGGTDARTVSLWIKTSVIGRFQTLIQWGEDSSGHLWMMRLLMDGTIEVAAMGGGVHSTYSIADGQWHQVMAILDEGQNDSAQIRLYIDGMQDSISYTTSCLLDTAQTVPLHLGVWYQSGTGSLSQYFEGLMDDVRIYSQAIDGAEIAPLYYADGLVHHWALDEAQGTVTSDSVGSQNAILRNMTDRNWAAGRTGAALSFDGIDDYVIVPDYYGVSGTDARTVSLWFKTQTSGKYQSLVQWGTDSTGQLWLIRLETDNTILVAAMGGGIKSSTTVTDGQWHHIAVMLDEGQTFSSQICLYIDGVLDTAVTGCAAINTASTVPVHFGAWYVAGTSTYTNYFNGQMDDICIYDRIFDIRDLMPQAPAMPTDGLLACWSMDQVEDLTVMDSVSSYDGTLSYYPGAVSVILSDSSTSIPTWDFWPVSVDGDLQIWTMPADGSDYPKFVWQSSPTYSGGSGTPADPYQIATADDIITLSQTWWNWDDCFIMTADVDMDAATFSTAIIYAVLTTGTSMSSQSVHFNGTFDGNGHKITNFTINDESNDYLGFFGYIGSRGIIRNLGLENYTISGTTGSYYVGGLAGYNEGRVYQCYMVGAVTGSSYYVGGLIGANTGYVDNCYSKSAVSGGTYVGGLAGYNVGSINCCYSTGLVNGVSNVGGLVGYSNDGSVTGSYWNTQTSGCYTSAGGLGRTTTQMQSLGMFTANYLNWVSGRTGNALEFDGTENYVEIPNYYGIGGTHARTVSLWIKTSASGRSQSLMQWGTDSTGRLWLIRIVETDVVQVAAYGGGVNGTIAVTDDQWHHIAAVLDEGQADSGQIRLYIDGVLDAVTVGGCTIATTQTVPVQLGAWYASSTGSRSSYFSGLMDDVCIYDRALPAEEIIPTDPIPTDGLVAYWPMDEISNKIVHDSASSYNGILHSTPLIGWDFVEESANGTSDYWMMPTEGGYPELAIFNGIIPSAPAGCGTVADPYQITSAEDLGKMQYYPLAHYILTGDIDLLAVQWNTAIAPDFGGTFDGAGHTIKNLSITGGGYLGLFGKIDTTGSVKDLDFKDCTINGFNFIGSLAGRSRGTVSHCRAAMTVTGSDAYSSGNLLLTNSSDFTNSGTGGLIGSTAGGSIDDCHTTGSVIGKYNVGGLAGCINGAAVNDCTAAVSISGPADSVNRYFGGLAGYSRHGLFTRCSATGTAAGRYSVGGLIGQSGFTTDTAVIDQCYAKVNVTGSYDVGGLVGYNYGRIDNCYATGSVVGSYEVGGLFGYHSGAMNYCYSTGSVSGTTYTGGLIGRIASSSSENYRITGCHWDTQTSGKTTGVGSGSSTGITGKTTAQLQTRSTYNDPAWPFDPYWPMWVTGKTGNALSFDGVDDYVAVPGYYGIGGTHARTITLWVKTSTTGVAQALVQWGMDASGQLWYLRIQPDGTVFVSAYAMGVISKRIVTDGQWHHIIAMLSEGQTDPTRIQLYIDGGLYLATYGSGQIATSLDTTVRLGVWYRPNLGTYSEYFSGLMDDVCIYDRTLTGSEIEQREMIMPTSGLVARWTMDQTEGKIVYDSVSSHNGLLLNSAGQEAVWSLCEGTNYPRLSWQIPQADWLCPDGVNTEDLDYFVDQWLLTNCTAENDYCDGTDLNTSGAVDLADLALFTAQWLQDVD